MAAPRAVVLGLAGPILAPDERDFFRDADPLGFILFARNVETPVQVRALVDGLRAAVGRADAPVLIDQEGGRVARLKPPHWRAAPPAKVFGDLYGRDPARALEAVRLNHRLLAAELGALGITVDCAPVLDLPAAGAHDVIGDRAFAGDPAVIAALGRAACEGLLAGGVLPVVKHVPGHGRARADSHKELPTVDASQAEMEATDFAPFRSLHDVYFNAAQKTRGGYFNAAQKTRGGYFNAAQKTRGGPWAMTAHVLYTALDRDHPATQSARVIEGVIRGHMGFDGVLISDDLGMDALKGDFRFRAEACLRAGCDIVLHCSGDGGEMRLVAEGTAPLAPAALSRVAAAEARRRQGIESFEAADGRVRLDVLLA